jgi:hypothetical protein
VEDDQSPVEMKKEDDFDILEEMALSRKKNKTRDQQNNNSAIDADAPLGGGLNKFKNIVQSMKTKSEPNQLDFFPSPDFDKIGRGLVYHCKGRHWACVDKNNYFQCKNGQLWAKQRHRPPSCIIDEVYLTNDDCNRAQIQKTKEKAPPPCGEKSLPLR